VTLHGKTIGVNVEDDDSTIDTCVSPFSIQMLPNTMEKKKLMMFMQIVMIMMKEN